MTMKKKSFFLQELILITMFLKIQILFLTLEIICKILQIFTYQLMVTRSVSIKSNQTSISLENMFFKSTKVSLSVYNKTTWNAPILGDSINFISPLFQGPK